MLKCLGSILKVFRGLDFCTILEGRHLTLETSGVYLGMENNFIVGKDTEKFALLAAIQSMKLWNLGIRSNRFSPMTIAARFKVASGSAKRVLARLEALQAQQAED